MNEREWKIDLYRMIIDQNIRFSHLYTLYPKVHNALHTPLLRTEISEYSCYNTPFNLSPHLYTSKNCVS